MERFKEYLTRRNIMLASIVALGFVIGIGAFIYYSFNNTEHILAYSETDEKKEDTEESIEQSKEEESAPIEYMYVDIKGEVVNPGVYALSSNSRVTDVIAASGGLTKNADTSYLNLSLKIFDEMIINVYSKTKVRELKAASSTVNVSCQEEAIVTKTCDSAQISGNNTNNSNNVNNDSNTNNDSSTNNNNNVTNNGLISINTATKESLMTLTGIGETKANDIISYRQNNGGFKSIEEIKNISGIGESTFAKIKDYITI